MLLYNLEQQLLDSLTGPFLNYFLADKNCNYFYFRFMVWDRNLEAPIHIFRILGCNAVMLKTNADIKKQYRQSCIMCFVYSNYLE